MSKIFFLKQFIKSPLTVGAIAPSSPQLAATIVKAARVSKASVVLEYGPGTGVFTKVILRKKRPNASVFAVEMNEEMAGQLVEKFPTITVFSESVENIAARLKEHQANAADSIVSGLPWASFPEGLRKRLLTATRDVLDPDGTFATFAYLQGLLLPTGRQFRAELKEYFEEVTTTPTVWRNLPPAFVYTCRKPRK